MSFTVDTTDNTQCVLKSWDLSEFLQLGHEETNPKWGWIESNVYNEGRAEKSDFDIGSQYTEQTKRNFPQNVDDEDLNNIKTTEQQPVKFEKLKSTRFIRDM